MSNASKDGATLKRLGQLRPPNDKKSWKKLKKNGTKLTKGCTKCLNVCGANCNWIIGTSTDVDFLWIFFIQFLPSLYAKQNKFRRNFSKNLFFCFIHSRVSTLCMFSSQDNGPVVVDFIHCRVCVCESAIYI